MKTLKEMVEYIHSYMAKHDQSWEVVEKEVLYDMMEEELLDAVEEVLTEEDMKNWVSSEDDTYLDKILNERLDNYPGLLEEIKKDILDEYINWES